MAVHKGLCGNESAWTVIDHRTPSWLSGATYLRLGSLSSMPTLRLTKSTIDALPIGPKDVTH